MGGKKDSKKRRRRRRRGQQRQTERARKTDREQTGSMSCCLEGGVIPACNKVVTSNSVLMRLHGEDKNKL